MGSRRACWLSGASPVTDKCYFRGGKFVLFNRKSSDDEDLTGAEEFARNVLAD